jgi:tetratricopeptide (TPR) repeat protein
VIGTILGAIDKRNVAACAWVVLSAGVVCLTIVFAYLMVAGSRTGRLPIAEENLGLISRYGKADQSEQARMMPEVVSRVRTYRKAWQGTNENQLLYESSYKELAEIILGSGGERKDLSYAESVRSLSSLRISFLSDPGMIQESIAQVAEHFRGGDYSSCVLDCRRILDGSYDRVVPVELTLGLTEARLGNLKEALGIFEGSMELTRRSQPLLTAAGAYLSACCLIFFDQYEKAHKMLRAVVEDYPKSEFATRASDLDSRMVLRPGQQPTVL